MILLLEKTKFDGTPGLWELITSKSPDSKIYTTNDLDSYETILLDTNAIVNPETGKVKSSSSEKYRNIIKPIYDKHLRPKKHTKYGKRNISNAFRPKCPVEMLALRLQVIKLVIQE